MKMGLDFFGAIVKKRDHSLVELRMTTKNGQEKGSTRIANIVNKTLEITHKPYQPLMEHLP